MDVLVSNTAASSGALGSRLHFGSDAGTNCAYSSTQSLTFPAALTASGADFTTQLNNSSAEPH